MGSARTTTRTRSEAVEAGYDENVGEGVDEGDAVHGEPSADVEPGTNGDRSWTEWLDGRPRRLKRGRDYAGDPKEVIRQAKAAAAELGKTAVASRDSSGKYDYLWVQFVDGEVAPGRPCPVCGGTELEKIQKHFLRCKACGATLKAEDDWEVAAGTFAPPAFIPGEEEQGELTEAPLRGEDFVEVLGARLLSADGRLIERPEVSEAFDVELGLRFARPIDAAWPRVRFTVRDTETTIRDQLPQPLRPSTPQTIDIRLRVPAGLLVPADYVFDVVVNLYEDWESGTSRLRLEEEELLSFHVGAASPEGHLPLGSPLRWELAVRDGDRGPSA